MILCYYRNMSGALSDKADNIPEIETDDLLLSRLPIKASVHTVELVAKALYDAIDREKGGRVLGPWEFGESIIIADFVCGNFVFKNRNVITSIWIIFDGDVFTRFCI
jgi:hypothetical protein